MLSDDLDLFHDNRRAGLVVPVGADGSDLIHDLHSGNDLAMIQAAGYGIAMGNATPDVLAAARYVTDDNNHDGVAKAIETYVLKG